MDDTQFLNAELVTFVFPSGMFVDKDFVRVELSFDTITWDEALD